MRSSDELTDEELVQRREAFGCSLRCVIDACVETDSVSGSEMIRVLGEEADKLDGVDGR